MTPRPSLGPMLAAVGEEYGSHLALGRAMSREGEVTAMKILHPTDFSECAAKAEAMAVDLASKLDGEIILLQVLVETPLYGEGLLNAPTVQRVYDAQRKWSEKALDARANDLRQRGIKASRRVQTGAPFEEI